MKKRSLQRYWNQSSKRLAAFSPSVLKNLDRETLLYKVMPHFFLELMHKYFRLKVEGLENIPASGRVIIAPNHSGFAGLDALLLSHEIHKATGRVPKVLTHHFWFLSSATANPMHRFGFIDASLKNGKEALENDDLLVLFPEGEEGNFKPSTKAYALQEFKRGFVRLAIQTGAPIIPTLVIGAEESNLNLSQLKLSRYLRGLTLPLPLNILPLPARWKIIFFAPIYLPYKAETADDVELVHEIAYDLRERMQKALNKEIRHRGSIFF